MERNAARCANGPNRPSLLCIAYAFAPISRSGTHRTLAYIRHADRMGWDTTVITVDAADEPIDLGLVARVPPSTRVVRTPWTPVTQQAKDLVRRVRPKHDAIDAGTAGGSEPGSSNGSDRRGVRDWVSRLMLTPDSRLGWVIPALRAAKRACRRRRPSAIYSTSPYASAHLVALLLSRWARLPWIADFRDPWRGNPFHDARYRSIETWDAWLERRVCRHATRVICNTVPMRDQLVSRMPWAAVKSVTLPNGYDAEWIEAVPPARTYGPGKFVFVHWGTCYGRRSPVPLMQGLRLLADRAPVLARRVCVQFVGDARYEGDPLRSIAERFGVETMVDVVGMRPHREAIALARGGNAALVLGVSGAGSDLQVPNKLYEALAIRKPILAVAADDSAVVQVLAEAAADNLVCDPEDAAHISLGLEMMAGQGGGFVDEPWSGAARFDRRWSTEAFGEMLCAITGQLLSREALVIDEREPVEPELVGCGSEAPVR